MIFRTCPFILCRKIALETISTLMQKTQYFYYTANIWTNLYLLFSCCCSTIAIVILSILLGNENRNDCKNYRVLSPILFIYILIRGKCFIDFFLLIIDTFILMLKTVQRKNQISFEKWQKIQKRRLFQTEYGN